MSKSIQNVKAQVEDASHFHKKEETEYIIPIEGSLGLLALGAEGLRAWRKIRDEHRGNVSHLRNVKYK